MWRPLAGHVKRECSMPNPPPTQLILRFEQLDAGGPAAAGSEPRLLDGTALYRIVGSDMPICSRHLSELASYQSRLEARVVLSLEQVDAIVVELGLRREDLMQLHGPQDPILGEERCRMCETLYAEGNVCHDDSCARPLHPQWPAVYCSSECAFNDG